MFYFDFVKHAVVFGFAASYFEVELVAAAYVQAVVFFFVEQFKLVEEGAAVMLAQYVYVAGVGFGKLHWWVYVYYFGLYGVCHRFSV